MELLLDGAVLAERLPEPNLQGALNPEPQACNVS